jgi:hypothetical protein
MKKTNSALIISGLLVVACAAVLIFSICNYVGLQNQQKEELQQAQEEEDDISSSATDYPTIAAAIDAAKASDGTSFSTQPIMISGTVVSMNEAASSVVLYDGDTANMAIVTFDGGNDIPEKDSNVKVCGYISKITVSNSGELHTIFLHKAQTVGDQK